MCGIHSLFFCTNEEEGENFSQDGTKTDLLQLFSLFPPSYRQQIFAVGATLRGRFETLHLQWFTLDSTR